MNRPTRGLQQNFQAHQHDPCSSVEVDLNFWQLKCHHVHTQIKLVKNVVLIHNQCHDMKVCEFIKSKFRPVDLNWGSGGALSSKSEESEFLCLSLNDRLRFWIGYENYHAWKFMTAKFTEWSLNLIFWGKKESLKNSLPVVKFGKKLCHMEYVH